MHLVPYLDPPHKSVRLYCCLCGDELAADTPYITRAIRDVEAREKGGQWLMCESCAPIFDEYGSQIESEIARERADFEVQLTALRKARWAEKIGRHDSAPATSGKAAKANTSPKARAKSKPRGAQIPNPKEVNGLAP